VNNRQTGFTLIEIAIVLVIIGLLLGGVVKGQEMIVSARVRNLIAQQDGIKAAFFAFQDRYRALPGDYGAADSTINCGASPCLNGNSNGVLTANLTTALNYFSVAALPRLPDGGNPTTFYPTAFGDFKPVPGGVMAGLAQVGKHLGEAAGPAEGLRVARRHRTWRQRPRRRTSARRSPSSRASSGSVWSTWRIASATAW